MLQLWCQLDSFSDYYELIRDPKSLGEHVISKALLCPMKSDNQSPKQAILVAGGIYLLERG
jgi:hypothetical protein